MSPATPPFLSRVNPMSRVRAQLGKVSATCPRQGKAGGGGWVAVGGAGVLVGGAAVAVGGCGVEVAVGVAVDVGVALR